ncbi:unnamed protein product [Taenia asiatica]|uniref:Uncharacterized protein n=1 Tax=Taenia asiatica TaxID=60517 RepID=A0A3P6PB98_TAEAS|nr:unnamed protein product [Taenia asiatica]
MVYTIFVLLIMEFRTKAPGAQTIAQFVGRRFGKVAHILTITLSLLTGLYTLSLKVIVGSKILDTVTQDVSKTAIVSAVFILVGAMVAVARRRSCSLIIYIITATILLICAFLSLSYKSIMVVEYGSDLLMYAMLLFSIQLFKKHMDGAKCLLCGKRRGHLASQRKIYRCRSMLECEACHTDTWYLVTKRTKSSFRAKPKQIAGLFIVPKDCLDSNKAGSKRNAGIDQPQRVFGCQTHGAIRAHTDGMERSVLHISYTVMEGMIPIFIIFPDLGVCSHLHFSKALCEWKRMEKIQYEKTSYRKSRKDNRAESGREVESPEPVAGILYFGLCTPFVGCLCLSILWARLSKAALLIGYFASVAGSLALWFVLKYASSLDVKQINLIGLVVAFLGGFLLPALITLLHTKAAAPELASGV